MWNSDVSESARKTESLLKAAAPAPPSDPDLASIRSRVSAGRSAVARPFRFVPAVVVAAAGVLVAAVAWQSAGTPPAFAEESAAGTLLPSDGVLHAVLVGEEGARSFDLWIDDAMGETRQRVYEGSVDATASDDIVVACGRCRSVSDDDPQGSGVRILEDPIPADAGGSPGFFASWIPQLAEAIRSGEGSVEDTITAHGEPAWLVEWVSYGVPFSQTVVLRKADYRPMTFAIKEISSDDSTEKSEHSWSVSVWERLDRGDVPSGTFDPDTVDHPNPDSIQEVYAANDPRLAHFSKFSAWRLAEDSGFGPVTAGAYARRGADDSEALTVSYAGVSSAGQPSAAAMSVTTYAASDSGDAAHPWQPILVSCPETAGEIDGRSYRLRASGPSHVANLVTTVDGQTILIAGATPEDVLAAFGALERISMSE